MSGGKFNEYILKKSRGLTMAEQRLIDANNLIEEIREERCYNCRNFKDMK